VLGFVLEDNSDLEQRMLDSTFSQFAIIGDQLSDPQSLQGSGAALVIGGLIALYGPSASLRCSRTR
jgi:membrane protein